MLTAHINHCVGSREHNLQRKAIRWWQLWKGYDHIGEMVTVTGMGKHPFCKILGGVLTMGGQAGQAVPWLLLLQRGV